MMIWQKRKQKLKTAKTYWLPQRTLFALMGLGAVAFGFVLGIHYGIQTVEAVAQGASSRVILSGIFSTLAPAAWFIFGGWLFFCTSKIKLDLDEYGIRYRGIGVTMATAWEDVLRIEWKRRRWSTPKYEVYLVADAFKIDRKWWSIGDHKGAVWLTIFIFDKRTRELAQALAHPLVEDILRCAPQVEIVEVGQRKKKR